MKFDKKMIGDACELYLKYGGKQHVLIEKEMRAKRWTGFRRQYLYSVKERNGLAVGWPELYGWDALLTTENREKLASKRRTHNDFERWLAEVSPEMNWTWKYQRYIYKRLAAIDAGECKRLMIFMPPRHGKSEMVTVRYTANRLLRNAKLNVIIASYTQRLADRFNRKIKRIVDSGKLKGESGKKRDKSRTLNMVSEWETAGGGVVRSVGVGGGIAGFGAGLIVIDDPVRNRADAESETYRDRVWDWFNDDIYTRMEPGAAIILIQTRWHEDDLAGRLLKEIEDGGEQWEVVSLPALAEERQETGEVRRESEEDDRPGLLSPASSLLSSEDPLGRRPRRALCPAMFDEEALAKYKRKLGTYSFAALYQQRPSPAEGGQFKRAWFKNVVDQTPPGLRWKRGYDLAISTKTSADHTASFRCAYDKQGNLYIADGYRAKIEYPEQRRYIIERMRSEPNTEHGVESAMHGKAVVQELRRDREARRYAFREVRVVGDKLTRALTWLNLAEAGKLILVRGPWISEFIDEVAAFPTGRYDDQIDAVSVAVQMTSRTASGFHTFA